MSTTNKDPIVFEHALTLNFLSDIAAKYNDVIDEDTRHRINKLITTIVNDIESNNRPDVSAEDILIFLFEKYGV